MREAHLTQVQIIILIGTKNTTANTYNLNFEAQKRNFLALNFRILIFALKKGPGTLEMIDTHEIL